ncbi:autotransporter outer membrane beta-barrel domain-containing protein [Helicobacter sp. 11S02596-1]|uniref:autotransporter outer membrane beta-barrel domain-containing protein n=1 Tax=Helicobacter sp. 11S02596-1 TaxID=1476194 RepID=UPI000BA546C8|nr:autotransporter outer membrane beta-barrel domain-containing protein [Helicobacter sp. 11S02596-1]PAF44502.1 hypothetical protein BJI48_03000 [Helicobacter sp. 11S02596-1]
MMSPTPSFFSLFVRVKKLSRNATGFLGYSLGGGGQSAFPSQEFLRGQAMLAPNPHKPISKQQKHFPSPHYFIKFLPSGKFLLSGVLATLLAQPLFSQDETISDGKHKSDTDTIKTTTTKTFTAGGEAGTFNVQAGGKLTIAGESGKLGHLYIQGGDVVLDVKNFTIGKPGIKDWVAIGGGYGINSATDGGTNGTIHIKNFESSTIYGDILYTGNAFYHDESSVTEDKKKEGFYFSSKSKLIGNIKSFVINGNNKAKDINFTFDDSMMVGNIETEVGPDNALTQTASVHFKNHASLLGNFDTKRADKTIADFNESFMVGNINATGSQFSTNDITFTSIASLTTEKFKTAGELLLGHINHTGTYTSEQKPLVTGYEFTDLNAHPEDLLAYLATAGISAFKGDITANNGTNNVDFSNALYLGGKIEANDPKSSMANAQSTNNITIDIDDNFAKGFQGNYILPTILTRQSPVFDVFTNSSNATNNIALSGKVKGTGRVHYNAGKTYLILADKRDGTLTPGTTNIAEKSGTDKTPQINGYTYEDGVLITFDSTKADTLLSSYRDMFPENLATLEIDKMTTDKVYKANLGGILVGEIESLKKGADATKHYEANVLPGSVFIGKLNIEDIGININLEKGAKLILSNNSKIEELSNSSHFVDEALLYKDTLRQTNNTIIDLATGGKTQANIGKRTDNFSTLTIKTAKSLENVIFRVGFNPEANHADTADKKADHIIIEGVKAPDGAGFSVLENYIQLYQDYKDLFIGDLRTKNILVASVQNTLGDDGSIKDDGKGVRPGVVFKTLPTDFGFETFITKLTSTTGEKSDGTTASDGDDKFTNYYVTSITARVNEEHEDTGKGALGSNLSVFLANINNINKRLGELRDNPATQGVWARVFNGMSHSNIGESLQSLSTNFQAGYDYAFGHNDARSIVGLAFSYGYNSLSSNAFGGNSNLFEIGAYYSFIQEDAKGWGVYSDTILKTGYILNNLSLKDNAITFENTLNSQAISLGEEVGYRFNFYLNPKSAPTRHAIYLEPSAEFIAGYITGGKLEEKASGNFLKGSIANIFDIRAKLGGTLGYSLLTQKNRTDFRLGAFYVGDYFAGGKMDFETNHTKANANLKSNHMALLSVGVNSFITKDVRLYLDVDAGFGGQTYNQDYLVSLGGRYSFGKQIAIKHPARAENKQNTPNFEKNLTPEQRRVLKNKQVLVFKGSNKTHCQGCEPEAGYYFLIADISINNKAQASAVANILKNYEYRSYQYKDLAGAVKTRYLVGPFKNVDELIKTKPFADGLSRQIYNNSSAYTIVYEVRDGK